MRGFYLYVANSCKGLDEKLSRASDFSTYGTSAETVFAWQASTIYRNHGQVPYRLPDATLTVPPTEITTIH